MKKLTLLGGLTPEIFLRDYWHKKPLLIRGAIPGFEALLPREELFAMAAREDVEARLVTCFDGKWNMQRGPLAKLPAVKKAPWTMLVQGVNLHHDGADALMRQFNFLPDARLDDLMISWATDGAGVGPHFDSYDVFLLQAHGKRRWRIGAQKDLALVEGLPLKILRDFRPSEEFVLEPGDMLYLPPHYAHDGIAEGECMTYSIGFRTPHFQELGEAFLQFMSDTVALDGIYADPELKATAHPAEIGKDMLAQVAAQLEKVRFTDEDVAIFLGEYLSAPKPNVFFDETVKDLSPAKFRQQAEKKGVKLARKTQMLYRGKNVFVNGESFSAQKADLASLVLLADRRSLTGAEFAAVTDDVFEALYLWYQDAWLMFDQEEKKA